MKTILILRHGKSDWDADYAGDHERPLAKRGQKGARKMGRFLTTARAVPDRAITSTAVRARETLATAAEAGGWTGAARVTGALYEATPQAVLAEIQAEPDDADTVVVVGHEPTSSGLVSLLIGGGRVEMKTAAVARVDVEVETWADVAAGRGTLATLLAPSALRPNAYRKLKKTIDKAIDARKKAEKQAAKTAAPKDPPQPTTSLPRGGVEPRQPDAETDDPTA
ncbi:SixA phosphatase family protein [Rubrivirga sp. IMCC45206]|uniref:SixA phosphatase family protein n=1 Tax=Rubrivirga sp. IMCC45206 TaxID=3391614 RepID=UPI0039900026